MLLGYFNQGKLGLRLLSWLKGLLFSVLFIVNIPFCFSDNVIKIALLDSYPWSYHGSNGEVLGIYPDLLQEIESRLNQENDKEVKLSIRINPLARIKHDIQDSNQLDITIMSFPSGRDRLMIPVLKLYKTPFIVISHVDRAIENVEQLHNKKLAVLQGGSGCPCLGEALPYKKVQVNNHVQGLKMLNNKRVDAAAGPGIRLLGNVSKLGMENSIATPLIYEWREVWLWAAKGQKVGKELDSSEVKRLKNIEALRAEFERLINRGDLKQYAKKYLTPAQLTYVIDN